VFFWDHETESFWLQTTGECNVGPQTGKQLKWIATEVTTWADWRKRHPKTTVLAPVLPMKTYRNTARGYGRYAARGVPMFPTGPNEQSPAYRPMDTVTIVKSGKVARCYPHPALREGDNKDGEFLVEKKGKRVVVRDKDGKIVPSMTGYWFAFWAFYPKGTVWERPKRAVTDPK
jgi:hypothetical protein